LVEVKRGGSISMEFGVYDSFLFLGVWKRWKRGNWKW
jgi:hypothetical protein